MILVAMTKLMGLFLVITFVVAMVADTKSVTMGTQAEDECNKGLRDMAMVCQRYMMYPANPKIDPSEACCSVVHKVDISCL